LEPPPGKAGSRWTERDLNFFLKMITKDPDLELRRNEKEEKVLEVLRQAGMLAFSNKVEGARFRWIFLLIPGAITTK
jgi:hypothetical protein